MARCIFCQDSGVTCDRFREAGRPCTHCPKGAEHRAKVDREQLDRLARVLNGYHEEDREWDHADICNELVGALRETGRTVHLDDDDQPTPPEGYSDKWKCPDCDANMSGGVCGSCGWAF